MDFVSEKLNSFTGNALSGINEMRRKKQRQPQQAAPDVPQVLDEAPTAIKSSAITSHDLQAPRQGPTNGPQRQQQQQSSPFGGDTIFSNQAKPPPIGFCVDLSQPADNDQGQQVVKQWPQSPQQQQPLNPELGEKQRQIGASDGSLYEGDAWSRLWFQRVMILTLIRLLLFIRKIYEDYSATKTYRLSGHLGHFLVSGAALFLPTIVFTIYRISRYLQVALPATRLDNLTPSPAITSHQLARKETSANKTAAYEDEGQLRRALMSSPQNDNDDGLVTARQSPSNLEEFHDSKSQQTLAVRLDSGAISPAPSTTIVKDSPKQLQPKHEEILKESVDIDKLGNIPDKESARLVIGASEQLLHGALFIFWQLKRQVDVMGYLVERSCLWRKPKNDEKEELDKLRYGSDGLEWFQDFYAAFLAILAQVYTLGLYWTSDNDYPNNRTASRGVSLSGAAGNLMTSERSEFSISQTAKSLSDPLHTLSGTLEGKDLLIISELVVSSAVVFSLLVAVRRRDDGPLTLGLSMLGWGSIFAARIIVIALAFVHIGWKIMIATLAFHILGITIWIYKIAIDSHNGKAGESEESKWQTEEGQSPDDVTTADQQTIELNASGTSKQQQNNQLEVTSQWTIMEHVVLISQIFTLFALPSLFYWPIMFNLKLHYRPFKYLALILSENTILIAAIWFSISSVATPGQWYLLGAVGGFSIVGFVFISLYISCKPSLTEYFARADELFNEADKSGIYFEFCSRVFKMPDLSKHAFRRLMNQTEEIQEIEVIDV